ncbi:MAG: HEAT repeat domain-containing protein, partial [Planctomycetota bacterium]
MRRVLTVLLALGVAGGAADDAKTLNTARRLLLSGKVDDRLDAVRLLGSVDGEVSVHLLGSAVKRSLAAMDELARPFDQLDGDYQRARNRVRSAREKGKRALLRRRQKELDELDADWGRYRGQLRAHLRLVLEAAAILREFSSDAAVAALEDAARKGGHPVQRQVVVSALGRSGLERSVPLLLELLDVRDGRVRAHAVRALEPFVGVPGVIDRVVELIDDEGWPVRLGAYRVMVGAPMRVAVPFFVRAVRRERGEMALAVDNYLEALTGQSFAGRTLAWRQWWDENRRAFGLGAFRRVEKKALPKGAETRARFFSVPIESERLVFCIDLSASMEKKMALEDPVTNELLRTYALPATRLGYAKAELIRAVRELPDGARFNIIAFSDRARRFSGRLERVDRASRRRALDWILDQEVGDLTNIWESLHVAFNGFLGTTAGVQAFRDLPDTIVFLTDGRPTRGRFQGHRSLL